MTVKHAIIDIGDASDPTLLMLHGGPGYYWPVKEIDHLHAALKEKGVSLRLLALQGRGCGVGDSVSVNDDLLDDNLLKRAHDLAMFNKVDILLGHSTGTMVALTALMEKTIAAKQVVLLSPFTASLGEHAFWVTEKAKKYPKAFNLFSGFVRDRWQRHRGDVPEDLREKIYAYWGDVFFSLPDEKEKALAKLHYLSFHVIDSSPWAGEKEGEPYTFYPGMIDSIGRMEDHLIELFARMGTITAHWWRTNYQDGYPFLDNVKKATFDMPIHILSGAKDEITPPHTVRALADILDVKPIITAEGRHMAETKMPGTLKNDLIDLLVKIAPRPA